MREDQDTAISVQHVGKTFRLPKEKHGSLKSALINFRKRGYEEQHVLNDLSFEIKKGEFFGIVGRNGSGKSTLLKLLAGIYTPTKGRIVVNGKLTPFIELGVGFNPELTGRENIFLNGALLGFNRKEMDGMYDDIVRFAELSRFMDQKLKNYSSGMQVRLAFSIAIKSNSEILLFDEVLAVGDERFQKKCLDVFRSLKKQGRTIILVTHDMGNVERFCDRAMVLDKSRPVLIGTPAEAARTYSLLNIDERELRRHDEVINSAVRHGSGEVKVAKASCSNKGIESRVFTSGESFELNLTLERQTNYEDTPIVCGLAFFNADGATLAGPNTLQTTIKPNATRLTFSVSRLPFAPGEYRITVALYSEDMATYDFLDKWIHFSVISDHQIPGLTELYGTWREGEK